MTAMWMFRAASGALAALLFSFDVTDAMSLAGEENEASRRVEFVTERIEIRVDAPILETMDAFESQMGWAEQRTWEQLVREAAPWSQVQAAAARMQGPHGFMIFHRVTTGALLSLSGKHKSATLYIVGNPVIANRILDQDVTAGLYVPFRVYVFDRGEANVSYIAYDRPGSMLASMGNVGLAEVSGVLDDKVKKVIEAVLKKLK